MFIKSPPEKPYYKMQVKAGKTYFWCQCGNTGNPPFCDGSHAGTGISPVAYQAEDDRIVSFCWCHKTKGTPLCDGSHKNKDLTISSPMRGED